MDFGFSEEQEMLRDATRRFLEKEMPTSRVRDYLEAPGAGFDPAVRARAAALGWFGLLVPEEHGGAGQSIVDAVVVAEELGRGVQPGPYLPTMVATLALVEAGSPEQQAEILPGVVDGSTVIVWAAPPLDGEPTVSGRPAGDGVVLEGALELVQDAHVSDTLVVTIDVGGTRRQVLVSSSAPGVSVRVTKGLDLARRLCQVTMSGVEIAAERILPHGDDAAIERQRSAAIVLQCAESVGGAERLLEMTVEYARDRVQFGRPIGSFQAIKHKCANMLVWVEASKSATYYAALTVQDHLEEAALAASIAKSYVGQACADVAGEALQVHGGIGFTWEHDVHLYLRRAKSNEALLGAPAWHRERICQLVGV